MLVYSFSYCIDQDKTTRISDFGLVGYDNYMKKGVGGVWVCAPLALISYVTIPYLEGASWEGGGYGVR